MKLYDTTVNLQFLPDRKGIRNKGSETRMGPNLSEQH